MLGPIDAARFPLLADYVARLPAGLASYPQALSKGILLKSSVSGHYFHPAWAKLPPPIVAAIRRPPLPPTWVSTVLTEAVFCAVADTFYPSEDAIRQWNYERTLGLARVPMYSALAKLAGLERFLRTAAKVHGLFQRGTDVIVGVKGATGAVTLQHPPHLHPRASHVANEGAFRATLETAGALDVEVKLVESVPTSARYELAWRP